VQLIFSTRMIFCAPGAVHPQQVIDERLVLPS